MESNVKSSLVIFVITFIGISIMLSLTNKIDVYQYMSILLSIIIVFVTVMNALSSSKMSKASQAQAEAASMQVEVAREALHSNVVPKLVFSIRPANDYYTYPDEVIKSWVEGTGIYIESVGLGTALNIKFKIKIIGVGKEHTHDIEFSRMFVGQRYTVPSPQQYPHVKIEEDDKTIEIIELQFEDVRIPSRKYSEDKISLELKPEHFVTPNKFLRYNKGLKGKNA